MHGVKPSRWTMAYFAVAIISLLTAEAALAGGVLPSPEAYGAPPVLATVHLVTLGWLTLLVLGALQQFVPVIALRTLRSQGAALTALLLFVVGLVGMEVGFLAMAGIGPVWLLPLGASTVVAGLVVASVNVALTLKDAGHLPFHARFVAAGLAFLGLTLLLGLLFALLDSGILPPSVAVRLALFGGRALPVHILVGIGGWLTLTAMGVAYKLLSMFSLAPEDRGRPGEVALWSTGSGLALVALSSLAGALAGTGGGAVGLLEGAGALLAAVGVAFFLGDMRRLYAARRRRTLELNAAAGVFALGGLGAGGVLSAAAFVHPSLPLVEAAVAAMLFLWLSALGLTQLYKIVPFLTWIERYGPSLGQGAVPRVQDLVVERRARPAYALYFIGAALLVAGFGTSSEALVRGAGAVMFLSTAAIAVELVRVRVGKRTQLAQSA